MFFDVCKAEMAQSLSSLQKSEILKLIILIFHIKVWFLQGNEAPR